MTNYYIRPGGSDSNNGLTNIDGGAFKTLSHACTHATVSGDKIYMSAGTFYETAQSTLAVSVDIIGAGMTVTIIESSYNGSNQPLIKAETSEGYIAGTAGNQEIKNIRFDGNMTTYSPIDVNFRSNVKIHDCTFIDFTTQGVQFYGQDEGSRTATSPYEPDNHHFPNYWCSGNEFYNNVVTNCSVYSGQGYGNLGFGTQNGMKVYGNTITQTARPAGQNGYGIKFRGQGYNRGTKCYNNTITVAPNLDEGKFDFSIENWNDLDECEYYNNVLQGTIDETSSSKRGTSYGVWIHDNIFGYSSQQNHDEEAIEIEGYADGVIISNNTFRNISQVINFSFIWPNGAHTPRTSINDIHIYDNLMYGVGLTNGGWSYNGVHGILCSSTEIADNFSNIYIYNNTIVASGNIQSGTYSTVGIRFSHQGVSGNNIQIRNNIIKGFTGGTTYSAPILASYHSTVTNLKITNNVFYGNGNSNLVKWTDTFSPGTGYLNTANFTSNPSFVNEGGKDYHLQVGSPAIGAGINTSLQSIKDYAYSNWNATPSIGAYEFLGGLTKSLSDVITLSDSIASVVAHVIILSISENTLTLSDSISRLVSYNRIITDSTLLTDNLNKAILTTRGDNTTIGDNLANLLTLGGVQVTDYVETEDDLDFLTEDNIYVITEYSVVGGQELADALSLSDNITAKAIEKLLSDSLVLFDTLYSNSSTEFIETEDDLDFLTEDDIYIITELVTLENNEVLVLTDTVTLSDGITAKDLERVLSDSLLLSDSSGKLIAIYPGDGVTFVDSVAKVKNFLHSIVDTITISDAIIAAVLSEATHPKKKHRCSILEILRRGISSLNFNNDPLVLNNSQNIYPSVVMPNIQEPSENDVVSKDNLADEKQQHDSGEHPH